MYKTWEVTYTLYEDSNMIYSLPGAHSLRMHVQADSYSQASQIVESMYPNNCRITGAMPLN
jgi:hypothetical protein